jgi:hypothetical protein
MVEHIQVELTEHQVQDLADGEELQVSVGEGDESSLVSIKQKPAIQTIINDVQDAFDPEMVESRDDKSGRVIVQEGGADVAKHIRSNFFAKANLSSNYYDDGEVEGFIVKFEIP